MLKLFSGGLYRITAIGTQGTCNCNGVNLVSAYVVTTYRVSHSADDTNYHYYDNGGTLVSDLIIVFESGSFYIYNLPD